MVEADFIDKLDFDEQINSFLLRVTMYYTNQASTPCIKSIAAVTISLF